MTWTAVRLRDERSTHPSTGTHDRSPSPLMIGTLRPSSRARRSARFIGPSDGSKPRMTTGTNRTATQA